MASVTICSDFEAKKKSLSLFPLCPYLFFMKWWDQMPWSLFSECWVLNQLFHSPLSLSSRGSLVFLHFLPQGWCHLHISGYWYFSRQSWFQLVLPPARIIKIFVCGGEGRMGIIHVVSSCTDLSSPCDPYSPCWVWRTRLLPSLMFWDPVITRQQT